MNSPISHLTEVLQKVKESALSFELQLKSSEAATRAALVDPILRALGWDIANPARVLVESTKTVSKKGMRVDYALLGGGDTKIIVEAKKLGENLKTDLMQIVQYIVGLGVSNLFVTDGLNWHHYHHFSTANPNPTRELNLQTDDLPQVAAYLVQHMDAALISPETPKIDELSQRVETLENLILELKNQASPSKNVFKMSNPTIAQKTIPVSNANLTTNNVVAGKGDNWFSIDDGAKVCSVKAIETTVEALRALAKVSNQILPEIEKEMMAQLSKRKVKVIKRRWLAQSQQALYDNPELFKSSVEIVPGWWLGTNYSNGDKRDMLATAAKVASQFKVQLEFHLI